MSGTPIRVLIVDDHEVVRLGLRTLLQSQADLELAGEATTVAEAVAEAARLAPDVVIMDVRLPDGSGVEACREIKAARPATQIIMLTSFADDDAVEASVLAGATGYLLKRAGSQDLMRSIRGAVTGATLLDPTVTTRLLDRFRRLATGADHAPDPLTAQEQRVLALIAEGRTNREIGEALGITEKTVKNYVTAILGKLQLRRRAEAAAFAARRGLRP